MMQRSYSKGNANRMLFKFQRGQSFVEFIVMSLVLVPLVIIVPLLGKYIDLAQTTTSASRYVAFEGTVHHGSSIHGWKSRPTLETEVRRRFYSRNDVSINTNDVAGEFRADRNPLWVDHRGDHLLPSFNNVTVTTKRETLEQPFGAEAGEFDLPQDNLYTGTVNVDIANVSSIKWTLDHNNPKDKDAPFDNLNLSMNRHTTVLVDPWTALGSKDVEKKVEKTVETGHMKPLATWGEVLMTLLKPAFGGNGIDGPPDLGSVEPDIVPNDRVLKAYK